MREITRRELVRDAAILAAGAYLLGPATALGMGGGGMGGGGGGMGGGATVIDPPVGPAFANPPVLPDMSADPGVVEVALDARPATVNVNGVAASLLTYNGMHPGGTIRVRNDQLLRVRMKNSLPANGAVNMLGHPMYVTNLHTHGLHVTPGDNPNGTHGDNMMVMLEPGDETTYEYDLSKQRGGTLNFYHPHIHGNVTDLMWAGMAGALVVEGEIPALSAYPEKIMVLKDIALAGNAPADR
jgi:FtsP/CotA-like multicopper oxidase with cupredoxin domain